MEYIEKDRWIPMEKKEMLYEGKAKKVYTTEDPDVLIVSYKDDATAFNGLKKGTIAVSYTHLDVYKRQGCGRHR